MAKQVMLASKTDMHWVTLHTFQQMESKMLHQEVSASPTWWEFSTWPMKHLDLPMEVAILRPMVILRNGPFDQHIFTAGPPAQPASPASGFRRVRAATR